MVSHVSSSMNFDHLSLFDVSNKNHAAIIRVVDSVKEKRQPVLPFSDEMFIFNASKKKAVSIIITDNVFLILTKKYTLIKKFSLVELNSIVTITSNSSIMSTNSATRLRSRWNSISDTEASSLSLVSLLSVSLTSLIFSTSSARIALLSSVLGHAIVNFLKYDFRHCDDPGQRFLSCNLRKFQQLTVNQAPGSCGD